MAAGTLLTYDRSEAAPPLHTPDAQLVSELLLRWHALEKTSRRQLAIALLNRHGIDVNDPTDPSLRAQLNTLIQGAGK